MKNPREFRRYSTLLYKLKTINYPDHPTVPEIYYEKISSSFKGNFVKAEVVLKNERRNIIRKQEFLYQ